LPGRPPAPLIRSIRSPSIATRLGEGKFRLRLVGCAKRLSQLGYRRAFSVTSAGIVSEQQIEWVFLAAARARSLGARHAAIVAKTRRCTTGTTRNIGPYPFAVRSSNQKAAEPRDISEAFIAPPDRVVSAEDFASRRVEKLVTKSSMETRNEPNRKASSLESSPRQTPPLTRAGRRAAEAAMEAAKFRLRQTGNESSGNMKRTASPSPSGSMWNDFQIPTSGSAVPGGADPHVDDPRDEWLTTPHI